MYVDFGNCVACEILNDKFRLHDSCLYDASGGNDKRVDKATCLAFKANFFQAQAKDLKRRLTIHAGMSFRLLLRF